MSISVRLIDNAFINDMLATETEQHYFDIKPPRVLDRCLIY